jgi:hypothetical protein
VIIAKVVDYLCRDKLKIAEQFGDVLKTFILLFQFKLNFQWFRMRPKKSNQSLAVSPSCETSCRQISLSCQSPLGPTLPFGTKALKMPGGLTHRGF